MVQLSMELVYLVTSVIVVVASSPLETVSRSKRSQSTNLKSQYSWICPSVVCHPVSPRCREVERIIFEYNLPDPSGRFVEIKCESCAYCLDMPQKTRRRQHSRRQGRSIDAILAHEPSTHEKDCRHVLCPRLPETCHSVKMTNVLLRGRHCRRKCPACYDGTIINTLE